ncbi:MAG: histidine--tRNA ligase [Elusimicrobia bacterium RIFOXYB2_FULL_48_7]|nr:MAG: histidine--tRNA ligase [Elusimicrobia bacterium RIFOXYB2_FULL_48_7]
MKHRYQRVRGTYDILPEDLLLYLKAEETARTMMKLRGYKEIRLPTFEEAGLFIHATGETTDIVEKEMYTFKDKKERQLALRPEGTPGVVRAYLENALNTAFPVSKFCYTGPMFRYERPQGGRRREFFQSGCEYFGNPHPVADAELILLMNDIYASLGISGLIIEINSIGCPECRANYRSQLLAFLNSNKTQLCADCNTRIEKNPLRALDCKLDREKFVNLNAPVISKALCADCAGHFAALQSLLQEAKVPFTVNPYIVRGLDYYTKTVFEAKVQGSDAICAGGRYDGLIKLAGGEETPAVGFAMGVDRTVNLLRAKTAPEAKTPPVFIVIQQEEKIIKNAFLLANSLAGNNIAVAGPYPDKSFKAQLRLADSAGSKYTLILGENEINSGSVTLKDMAGKTQETVKQEDIINRLKSGV